MQKTTPTSEPLRIKSRSMMIGFALTELCFHSPLKDKSLNWHLNRINSCIDANNIYIQLNQFGQFPTLVMWDNFSASVSQRIMKYGLESIQPEDHNSGNKTWLIEFCAHGSSLKKTLQTLRDHYLKTSEEITYFRMKNGKRIAKQITRNDCSSFFKTAPEACKNKLEFLKTKEGAGLNHALEATKDAAQLLGEIAMLACHIPEIGELPLVLALERLCRPGKLYQRRIYRDTNEKLSGYIDWAWLDQELARIGLPPPHALQPFQWNEGSCLVVCDAIATTTGFKKVYTDLINGLYPDVPMYTRPSAKTQNPSPAIKIIKNGESGKKINITTPVIDVLDLLR